MSAFPCWKQFAIPQRRAGSGCIPTGYEVLLRAAKAKGIVWETFQDEFDLDKDWKPGEQLRNHFVSVSELIHAKYSQVRFETVTFPRGQGKEKLELIEQFIDRQQPILISLNMQRFGSRNWHIMPVVDASDDELLLLFFVHHDMTMDSRWIKKDELVFIHDNFEGGWEVSYLAELHTVSTSETPCEGFA